MDTTQIAVKYDSWHKRMNIAGRAGDPLVFPWYKSAFEHVKRHAHGELLEVGCGRGEFALWLGTTLPDLSVTAVDCSKFAIAIARSNGAKVNACVRFAQDDAQALGFASQSFDYVVSCECMEHVLDPRKMATEIARVLKPGGKFCLTTPSHLNGVLLAWAKSWITGAPYDSGAGVQPHENFYFFWNVRTCLRKAGLKIDEIQSCCYQWLLLPGVDPAKLRSRDFSSKWARALAKPFGLHFSFFGHKPV
jgi:ubiquinone/menaquinone biosynthesis C-methylase UbiE